MKVYKNVFLIFMLSIIALLSGCSMENVSVNDSKEINAETIKEELTKDPQSTMSMLANKMDTLEGVHIEYRYDIDAKDALPRQTRDIQKEGDKFISLNTYNDSYVLYAECNANTMPDFAVAKGWDPVEYCTSVYGEGYRAEDEVVTKSSYLYSDKNGNGYYSSDGTTFESIADLGEFNFHDFLSAETMEILEYGVNDNEDGGITIELKRHFADLDANNPKIYQETFILNQEGFIVSKKSIFDEEERAENDNATFEYAVFSGFNEKGLDPTAFPLGE